MTPDLYYTLWALAFDALLVAGFHFLLRTMPGAIPDRRAVGRIALCLSGFVFHAFMFASWPFMLAQLAAIAGVLAVCWLHAGTAKPELPC